MKNDLTEKEINIMAQRENLLESVPLGELVDHFPLYIRRQELARYLVRYELYKKIVGVKGSIVECGVHKGASLLLFAKLSAIFEPYALYRRIIGFDSFEGFPAKHRKDDAEHFQVGEMSDVSVDVLNEAIQLFDDNRPVGHVPKVDIVKGDAHLTIPEFFKTNPHTLVALLYLDFDTYEPTATALEVILNRMPKGAIVAFDELNEERWQGETIAFLEKVDANKVSLEKFPWEPHISYFRLDGSTFRR